MTHNPRKHQYPLVKYVNGWVVLIGTNFVATHAEGRTLVDGHRVFRTRSEARAFAKELRPHVRGRTSVRRAQVTLTVVAYIDG